jgi:hypothetical protein
MLSRFLFFLLFFVAAINLYGQRTNKYYFEGFYNNQPCEYLAPLDYDIVYSVPAHIKAQMNEKGYELKLKGYSKGEGYLLVFKTSEPEVVKHVYEKKNAKGNVSYKAYVKAASNSSLLILDKNRQVIRRLSFEPELVRGKSEGLGYKSSEEEAMKQCDEIVEKKADYLKTYYVKELFEAYQDTLDKFYGNYAVKQKFYVEKVKEKKFAYDDYNGAAEKFKKAIEQPQVDSSLLNEAISLWLQCEQDYKPGRKNRISKRNIDELYLNLMQAYFVSENYKKVEEYRQKCASVRGNSTSEFRVKQFVDEKLKAIKLFANAEERYRPKAWVTKTQRMNNAILLNYYFGQYFKQGYRPSNMIPEYFINNNDFVKSVTTSYIYGYEDEQKSTEEIFVEYNRQGVPKTMGYTLNHNGRLKTYHFNFYFNEQGQISHISQNGVTKMELKYQQGLISEIVYSVSDSKEAIMRFKPQAGSSEIATKVIMKDGDQTHKSRRKHYLSHDEHGYISGYSINGLKLDKIIYDEYGNWAGFASVNESTGRENELMFELNVDKHNKSVGFSRDGFEMTREIDYMF